MAKLDILDQAAARAFIRKADNGSIKPQQQVVKKPRVGNQFTLSLSGEQETLLNSLTDLTGERRGQIIWQALVFAKKEPISLDFLNEYINFVYYKGKTERTKIHIQRVVSAHEDLKELSSYYKGVGYNIGIKGVVLLYLLNYAKNHLKMDISSFENFSE